MRKFLMTLTLMLGAFSQLNASTIDGYSMPLISNDPEVNFVLNTIQTRTEYRNETVAKTCYRREFDGYRNICNYYPEVVCYEDRMSRRICETRQVYRCHSDPVYRTVPYTCYETVSVPYEVFSHKVKAGIKVTKKTDMPEVSDCNLNFTLEGQSLRTAAHCPALIVSAKKTAQESRTGDTLVQDYTFDLSFADTATVVAPVSQGIKEMRLEGQNLVFKTGDLSRNPNFSLKLFAERRKFLREDETLINRNLAPNEYSFTKTSANEGIVKINLSNLFGGVNTKKKHVFKVNLDVLIDRSSVLNATLPDLSADSTLVIND